MKLVLSLTDQSFAATKSVGIFNVSMGLAKGLMQCPEVEELHILGNAECSSHFRDVPPHVHIHLADKPVPGKFSRIWWDQAGVCNAIRRIGADWAILPKGFPPFFPALGHTRLACYLHDVNWEYYTGPTAPGDSPFPAHELLYFRTLGLRALEVADVVLTSTRFNKARYHAYNPQANVAVAGIGFDTPARPAPAQPGRDVLFYVSPYPHKLTALGIERLSAWLAQRPDAQDIRIHLVGRLPQGTALPSAQWVQHGRMPGEELDRLMRETCRTAAYFSAYEGFGMPPVECLRAGLPCVASDLPPIRENIPARYLFDSSSEQSFIRTMNAAYDNPRTDDTPAYPTWREVAQRCVRALQNNS
ncbi:MAG: glycosyltransferase [Akkermansia sp.]|nr:glycosyltransferase [Akkermansia sp.]